MTRVMKMEGKKYRIPLLLSLTAAVFPHYTLCFAQPKPGPLSKLTQSHDSHSLPGVCTDRISCKLESQSKQQYRGGIGGIVPTLFSALNKKCQHTKRPTRMLWDEEETRLVTETR